MSSELDYGISALLECLDSDDDHVASAPPAKRARHSSPGDDAHQDLASLSKGTTSSHHCSSMLV